MSSVVRSSVHVICHSVCIVYAVCVIVLFFFFQAEDGIRYLVRSRGLGDVYKRQRLGFVGDFEKASATESISAVPSALSAAP